MNPTHMTTGEVLAELAREWAHLMRAVHAAGEGAATIPVTAEGWTAKDVLAHLIHWSGQLAWGMGAPLTPPPYVANVTGRPAGDEWNALVVAYYSDWPLEQVRSELARMADALVAEVRKRTDVELNATGAIPWDMERPVWQQVAGEGYEHWGNHAADIERAARG